MCMCVCRDDVKVPLYSANDCFHLPRFVACVFDLFDLFVFFVFVDFSALAHVSCYFDDSEKRFDQNMNERSKEKKMEGNSPALHNSDISSEIETLIAREITIS